LDGFVVHGIALAQGYSKVPEVGEEQMFLVRVSIVNLEIIGTDLAATLFLSGAPAAGARAGTFF